MIGPVPIDPSAVWRIALSNIPLVQEWIHVDWSKAQGHIIWDIRFPRVLLGAVVGAGLAVVGVTIQALVRNPLADPYILGVSSGASVAATLVILFGAFRIFGQYALSISAFLGAMLAIGMVFLLAHEHRRISTSRLLLSGIAVSIILFLLLASLLTGVMVAVSGAIGFVGLMMPHIVLLIVGSDHRRVLPLSALLGAIFMVCF